MRSQTKARDRGKSAPPPHREPAILVVDGDEGSLKELQGTLRAHGFSVKGAPSSLHAIRVLEREPLGLVLAEQRMPEGMDGLGLCVLVKSRWPKVRRVVMAKRPTGELVMQAKILADARTLLRPVSPAKLVAVIDEELRAFAR